MYIWASGKNKKVIPFSKVTQSQTEKHPECAFSNCRLQSKPKYTKLLWAVGDSCCWNNKQPFWIALVAWILVSFCWIRQSYQLFPEDTDRPKESKSWLCTHIYIHTHGYACAFPEDTDISAVTRRQRTEQQCLCKILQGRCTPFKYLQIIFLDDIYFLHLHLCNWYKR